MDSDTDFIKRFDHVQNAFGFSPEIKTLCQRFYPLIRQYNDHTSFNILPLCLWISMVYTDQISKKPTKLSSLDLLVYFNLDIYCLADQCRSLNIEFFPGFNLACDKLLERKVKMESLFKILLQISVPKDLETIWMTFITMLSKFNLILRFF